MAGASVLTQLCRRQRRARIVPLAPVAVVTGDAVAAVDRRLETDAGARVETGADRARVVARAVGTVPARPALAGVRVVVTWMMTVTWMTTSAGVRVVTGGDAVTLLAQRPTCRQTCVHLAALIAVES